VAPLEVKAEPMLYLTRNPLNLGQGMAIHIPLLNKSGEEDVVLFPQAEKRSASGSGTTEAEPWLEGQDEGQLAVDVFETEGEIVVKSAIAGVKEEDLEVFLHNDMLTIRGQRTHDSEPSARYAVRECHWGPFSRSLILPKEIDADRIAATLKNGIMTVRLPKIERSKKIFVKKL